MDSDPRLGLVQTTPFHLEFGCGKSEPLIWPSHFSSVITGSRTAKITATGASLKRWRTGEVGRRQLYIWFLGEINDSPKASWTSKSKCSHTARSKPGNCAAIRRIGRCRESRRRVWGEVRLSEFELRAVASMGACWAGCQLWEQASTDKLAGAPGRFARRDLLAQRAGELTIYRSSIWRMGGWTGEV